MPATFSIAAGSVDDGIKRINFSEPVTVTITGDVTVDFGDGQGELTAGTHTVSNALDYWTLKITGGTGGGTITFGKRKQVTYLHLAYLNSLVVKGDITGMKLTSLLLYSLGLSTITGDISGMELTYLQGERDPGELPATFTVTAGDGTKFVRVKVSETTTVTPAGGTSIRIGSSGDFVTTPLTLAANTDQDIYFKDAGSFSIPKRKLVTYLYLNDLGSSIITGDITGMNLTYLLLRYIGSSVITGDITGMKLTTLYLESIGSSVITGDITGMPLTNLYLNNLGSSVITGDITGMKLKYLYLYNLGSSIIEGEITGMELKYLYLYNLGSSIIEGEITGMELKYLYLNGIGSSLTYGTNSLNITHNNGVQLLGNTVFATAAEYEQLIHDAAIATWAGAYPFRIEAGTTVNCPDWDTVKSDVAVLLNKAAWTIIPSAWLTTGGGSWPTNWNEYTGE
jgi:hypothetical protein